MKIEQDLWVYLSSSPLLFLTLTLVVYLLAHRLSSKTNHHPLLNPIVVSVVSLIIILLLTKTSYSDYFEGAQFIHFLLGPATVALAVPLYQQLETVKRFLLPIILSIILGSTIGALSSIIIAKYLGASDWLILSLAPKSVTTPVAMSISEYIGGIGSLTAAMVVCTGMLGGVLANPIFSLLNIVNDNEKGLALGVTAHGLGTVKAFQISPQAGAFAGLAMSLSAMVTALILPWLVMAYQ